MKTVRDMYRAGGMNDEYGQGGMNEYKKSGKMPPQLLEYFKKKGEDKMKEYQDGGRFADDSRIQQIYDDASAIGMGLLSLLSGEGDLRERYELGYGREAQADLARQRSGQAGMIDASALAAKEFLKELTKEGMEYVPSSVQKHPIDKAARAFDRARMTSEEREALLRR